MPDSYRLKNPMAKKPNGNLSMRITGDSPGTALSITSREPPRCAFPRLPKGEREVEETTHPPFHSLETGHATRLSYQRSTYNGDAEPPALLGASGNHRLGSPGSQRKAAKGRLQVKPVASRLQNDMSNLLTSSPSQVERGGLSNPTTFR